MPDLYRPYTTEQQYVDVVAQIASVYEDIIGDPPDDNEHPALMLEAIRREAAYHKRNSERLERQATESLRGGFETVAEILKHEDKGE